MQVFPDLDTAPQCRTTLLSFLGYGVVIPEVGSGDLLVQRGDFLLFLIDVKETPDAVDSRGEVLGLFFQLFK